MKSVAIYGFAPQTRDLINQSDADEVWSLNTFYNYGLPEDRVTRTFEMHSLWMHSIKAGQAEVDYYWNWLKDKHPFCVYFPKVRSDFAADFYRIKELVESGEYDQLDETEKTVLGEELKEIEIGLEFFKGCTADIRKYPLQEIIDDTIPILECINTDVFPPRGMEPYYISSIDYMTALAIYEGFDRIEYYGVELREKTEWAMQKSGATFWAGFARGRGIEVLVPKNSVLIAAPLYGISSGDQMIPIQVPEHLKKQLTKEFDDQRNKHNHLTGRFTVAKDKRDDAIQSQDAEAVARLDEELRGYRLEIENAWRQMYMAEGGINVLTYLIDHENMKLQPLTLESITRMEEIVLESEKEG